MKSCEKQKPFWLVGISAGSECRGCVGVLFFSVLRCVSRYYSTIGFPSHMSLYLIWLGERLGHNQDHEIMDISDNAVAQLISAFSGSVEGTEYGKNQTKIKISPIVNLR